ncbi:protein phosphatase 2C domain-containing protein [Halobacillus litoralis]|uniref:protein phosphatase 2C domain-containing protein n=1 Tax=Halobacillus litoralis TaxID=45668 RepID=UPI001CD65D39|nr:protein phosphatase 2C domain-containing protein [Halobacillus litoralis]MCA0971957.1 protein phosphatase 2C domain-containing protein [Halobacillus litoralis]
MIRIETLQRTSPYKRECEDALVINERASVYAVLDGATPLVPFKDEDGHNGAYLAANLFKETLGSMSENDTLKDTIQEANQALHCQMKAYNVDVLKGYERWTTCVAAVQLDGDDLHFAQLGDSMIVVTHHDDSVQILTKDTVKGINVRAKKRRGEDRKKGISVPDEAYFEDRLNALKYNRTLSNEKDGYTVADGRPEAIKRLQVGRIPKGDIKEVIILSDGLFHPEWSLHDVIQHIQSVGLASYIEGLTELLQESGAHIDDRTAIRLNI